MVTNELTTEVIKVTPSCKEKIIKVRAKISLETGENKTFDEVLNILIDNFEKA